MTAQGFICHIYTFTVSPAEPNYMRLIVTERSKLNDGHRRFLICKYWTPRHLDSLPCGTVPILMVLVADVVTPDQ